MQRIIRIIFKRSVLLSASTLLQLIVLGYFVYNFSNYFFFFYAFFSILSVVAVIYILNKKSDPTYKLAWIIPIILFPIFGGLFYLLIGGQDISKEKKANMQYVGKKMNEYLKQDKQTIQKLNTTDLSAHNQSRYIEECSYCPVYQNTYSWFLPSGEKFLERLLKELKKAEKFIFLEFFIIEEGVMWNSILEILKEKVKENVDVRVIYDDFGCMNKLPYGYEKKLEQMGIKCSVFNPFMPIVSIRLNNRDHRKIAIIDGQVAYTGGVNLADEYINAKSRFGHWRDCAIEIKGEAVWNFTVTFLSNWNYLRCTNEDFSLFKIDFRDVIVEETGFVQPFDDSPLDDNHVSEAVYLNLINNACRYIYIETPYLIADYKMMNALTLAAKRGVDVRILTPFIPDKKLPFEVTKSNYQELIEAGALVYQYKPGFNHGKTIVVDDKYAVVGTINLDFRSFYLHFECGVWLYNTTSVIEVKNSSIEAFGKSIQITMEDIRNTKWIVRVFRSVLKIFSPLL